MLSLAGCYIVSIKPDANLDSLRYLCKGNDLLSGDDVRQVFKDKEGNTWFLTEKGITFINAKDKERQHYFHQFQNETGFNAYLEIDSRIYFGSEDGQIWSWNKRSPGFSLGSLKAKAPISGICQLSDHRILVITQGDGMFITDDRINVKMHYSYPVNRELASNTINNFYKDKIGDVWLDADAAGVVYFDAKAEKLYHFLPKSDEQLGLARLQPNFFVIEDANQRLWVHPGAGGFSEFDRKRKVLKPFYNDPSDPNRRFFNTMHNAFVDRQGDLWFSTRSPGLEKCTFFQSRFYSKNVQSMLQQNGGSEVRTTFEDHYKRIWIADKEGKIELYNSEGTALAF